MRARWLAAVLSIAVSVAVGCASTPRPVEEKVEHRGDGHAAIVAAMMAGQYDSRDQAAADRDYFAISLAMVPIWPGRDDGQWLYVEQAMADTPDKPYRQRVYRVSNGAGGEVLSAVYTLDEPARFVQGWRSGALAALRDDMLVLRAGCSVHLRRDGVRWQGATHGRDCASDLRGASYATAEVQLEPGRMTSWDRGFDTAGMQVWGATRGAYVFVKRGPVR
jgi:CpeT protein